MTAAGRSMTEMYTTMQDRDGSSQLDVKHNYGTLPVKLLNMIASGVGIPGNLLVLIVIGCSAEMRKKIFNKFIFNQSLFDLGVCLALFFRQVRKRW